jgi:secondary thiamine-phosphate synthase enzyme
MLITVSTDEKRQIIDLTEMIETQLSGSGLVNVFAKHTTTAITVADLDPGTDKDILTAIDKMTPSSNWNHPHDPSHFPDHLWSSLIGPGISLPYLNGHLAIGTWQRLILVELNGPQKREIELTAIKSD